MTLSEELAWRGFVNQTTLKDITDLDKESLTFYWGVDPSAASMQVGNLAMAMMARHFIAHGHKAVLLVGGATGMIGDPDGKDEERVLKPLEEIAHNKASIAEEYSRIFADQPFTLVDNYDWFKDIGYLNFLREIGKHFSMTQLLQRDFVQSRIGKDGKGISYAEFSYSLIQGYDFLHLFRKHNVTLQVCGADQWGNSISGVELIRKLEGKEAHIWSGPLIINRATGKKFGKSEGGAVWLNPELTSVFDFYQFWLNADDAGVEEYLKIYTLLPKETIESVLSKAKADPKSRLAQKTLAYEVTKIVHGHEAAEQAKLATESIAQGTATEHVPTFRMPEGEHAVIDIVIAAGFATSKAEARRLIEQGGIRHNGEKVQGETLTLHHDDIVRAGKRRFAKVTSN